MATVGETAVHGVAVEEDGGVAEEAGVEGGSQLADLLMYVERAF